MNSLEHSGFFNAVQDSGGNYDRVYLADDFAAYFASFIGNGVFGGKLNELQVTSRVTPGMGVIVQPGQGWINGYWYLNDDTLDLPISVADGVLNRIDAIALRWSQSDRICRCVVIRGTPATNPTRPAPVRNTEFYDLILGYVRVNAGVVNVQQGNITDTRGDSNLCGYVTGVVQQIDASEYFAQLEKIREDLFNLSQQQIQDLIDQLNELLAGDVAAELLARINDVAADVTALQTRADSAVYTVNGTAPVAGNVTVDINTVLPSGTVLPVSKGGTGNSYYNGYAMLGSDSSGDNIVGYANAQARNLIGVGFGVTTTATTSPTKTVTITNYPSGAMYRTPGMILNVQFNQGHTQRTALTLTINGVNYAVETSTGNIAMPRIAPGEIRSFVLSNTNPANTFTMISEDVSINGKLMGSTSTVTNLGLNPIYGEFTLASAWTYSGSGQVQIPVSSRVSSRSATSTIFYDSGAYTTSFNYSSAASGTLGGYTLRTTSTGGTARRYDIYMSASVLIVPGTTGTKGIAFGMGGGTANTLVNSADYIATSATNRQTLTIPPTFMGTVQPIYSVVSGQALNHAFRLYANNWGSSGQAGQGALTTQRGATTVKLYAIEVQ